MDDWQIIKHLMLDEKKDDQQRFAKSTEPKKEIYDLLDDSLDMVQDVLGDMQRKRKTKGIENLWLLSENLAKVKTLVEDKL